MILSLRMYLSYIWPFSSSPSTFSPLVILSKSQGCKKCIIYNSSSVFSPNSTCKHLTAFLSKICNRHLKLSVSFSPCNPQSSPLKGTVTPFFKLLKSKPYRSSLFPFFLSHPTIWKRNPIASIFQIYLKTDYLSPSILSCYHLT